MQSGQAGIDFIKAVFGPSTEAPVYVCSLANERDNPDEPGERRVATREPAAILGHIKKWDRPARGFFFCVSTIQSGAKREKAATLETPMLWADIDFKDISDSHTDVERKLANLRLPPSITVASGNGIHAYWLLTEALATQEHVERLELALRQLADLVGGDLQVCEVSRLMRLPGTHNTKNGAFTPVEILASTEARYELDDLEEWLSETSPVILRKERPAAVPETNPFLKIAAELGFKPSIDVEKRLGAMSYMGGGDAAVHATQLAVSASLLNQGQTTNEVVETLLAATKAAAGEYGHRWNWRREEKALVKMCEAWLKKHPAQPARSLSAASVAQSDATLRQAREREIAANGIGGATVTVLAEARQAKKRKSPTAERQAIASVVADGVIEAIRTHRQDILLSEGEVWLYETGTWHVMTPADQQWILTLIQEGFEALNEPAKPAALTATYKRLTEHPGLFKREVPWADGNVIVCQNGVLEINDRAFHAHAPKWFARRKIGASYEIGSECPKFKNLLTSMFASRDHGTAMVSMVQEWAGAALAIAHLSREERKALLLVGPSRTGKTELSRVMRLLIGEPIATPSVAEISERFGLASLYEAAAWIRDDAINEGDDLDPQRFKTIVTGEPIDIERKHRPAVTGVELTLPVLLTTNALPKARDKSDAIFNRSIILEMTNVVTEAEAYQLRVVAGVPRGDSIGSHIWRTEASGILNWALEGLTRLLERGSYDIPDSVRNAIQRFKDDNNPVGEWARVAVARNPHGKVSRADIACAYHGWQREQDGDDAKAFGNRGLMPRLRAIVPEMGDVGDVNGRRYVTGVHLTNEGLQFWDLHNQGPQLKGGSKGTSLTKLDVNKTVTATQDDAQTSEKIDDKTPRF